MTVKLYTNEQIKLFHQKYIIEQKSLISFAKEQNLSAPALRSSFKKLGLEIIPQSITRRKFPINENYFEIINTKEKAYWLGFLYADACNTPSKNRLEISLAKQDKEILEKLSSILLNGNVNILEYKSKKKNTQDKVSLFIINKKISLDLFKWGCTNKKTFDITFPNLEQELHASFIRGYFDGDGMLTFEERKRKYGHYTAFDFSITSTKDMVEKIQDYFADLDVNSSINKRHKNRNTNNFTLRVSGNKQIRKVCDYLYSESTIHLQRKYNLYLKLVNLTDRNC